MESYTTWSLVTGFFHQHNVFIYHQLLHWLLGWAGFLPCGGRGVLDTATPHGPCRAGFCSWVQVPWEHFLLPPCRVCEFSPLPQHLKAGQSWVFQEMLNSPAVYSHCFLWPGQRRGGGVETGQSVYWTVPQGLSFREGEGRERQKSIFICFWCWLTPQPPYQAKLLRSWPRSLPSKHRVIGLFSWGQLIGKWPSVPHTESGCICFSSSKADPVQNQWIVRIQSLVASNKIPAETISSHVEILSSHFQGSSGR